MRIGEFEFDPNTGELRHGKESVRLEPQPAAVLSLLAMRPGELVSHAEIRRAVWGDDTHVNFSESVQYCVRQIRLALDDSARQPTYIETIPRRGYRLIGKPSKPPVTPRRSNRVAWAALAIVVMAILFIVEQRPNHHHATAFALLKAVHGIVY